METVRLGRTELRVTPIAYGTWQFGGEWGEVEERSAIESIRHARELGINVFDTAQGYGFGTAERLLGRALADEMDRVVIATKGGLRMDGGTLVRDSSPTWIRRGVEESLSALGVDRIDLYQVHWPDPKTPPAETAAALWDMVDEGLIGHVGVSNFDSEQFRAFSAGRQVEALQSPYHLFHRDIEGDVLPQAAEHDVGVLAYGPLAHGLLGGRFDESTTFPADDWRSGSPDFSGAPFRRNLEVVGELRRFAEERDATIGQLAVAWVLAHPAVQVAIVGSRRRAHLDETVGALDIGLSPADLAQIDRIMSGAVPLGAPAPEGA
ncbi:aldo/keto reductase [Actinomadura sp. 7K534]|uniref:aldo/keto reductase n=1 Tax=Actinomadura sp. 7K534 TaxID=2530366 RepID=UPI001047789D|nr:aldo/keto reductase [Actinomadura sp. 7K534]TDB93509.1 aldo/keto reductase [Actinomadura sp. 7K534]